MKRKFAYPIITLVISLLLVSCQSDFLDIKPDKSLVIPSTLNDFQSLMDNPNVMNITPGLGELACDDYYTSEEALLSSPVIERNSYTWKEDIYEGSSVPDWDIPYQQVFYANVVLEGLDKLDTTTVNHQKWDQIKGSALFYRALAFYNLARTFAAPYEGKSAQTGLGIPIRMSADINAKYPRATLQQTYQQIIQDLKLSIHFLPEQVQYNTRPSIPAVYALLARIYLSMNEYDQALLYADSCLQLRNELLDYNQLDSTVRLPFHTLGPNKEVIFYGYLITYATFSARTTMIDSILYRSYNSDDLRKAIFFTLRDGTPHFRGSYTSNLYIFGGLATDEIYLIRAECLAREGKTEQALNDLNTLLKTRYKKGTFIPVETSSDELIPLILNERRKELVFRGLRWPDLRRLNLEGTYPTTLMRMLNGEKYVLMPNDPKYTMPIPDNEIAISGIKQNKR